MVVVVAVVVVVLSVCVCMCCRPASLPNLSRRPAILNQKIFLGSAEGGRGSAMVESWVGWVGGWVGRWVSAGECVGLVREQR